MVKAFQCVASGKVPGIYLLGTKAHEQIEGYTGACHGEFDDIDSAIEFMISKGVHQEDNIYVFGKRDGRYPLREWLRKNKPDTCNDKSKALDSSETFLTVNNYVVGYIAGFIHQRPRNQIRDVVKGGN